jgi:hypothetical protein
LSAIKELKSVQHFLPHCVSYSSGHNRSRDQINPGRDRITSQLKNSWLSAALVMLAMPVVAPRATPDPAPKSEVGQRQENQQDRIAQGVKSGQLTAGETAHLEKNQARLNQESAMTAPPMVAN